MPFAQIQSEYYCGIDLHARNMYVCVMNQEGKIFLHQYLPNDVQQLQQALTPYQGKVVIGVESTYNWYWLADVCTELNIPFYLGHALSMRAVHGGKKKNDQLDSQTITHLMRTNLLPMAYAYPKEMRATRDLLRRRQHFVRWRAELYTHLQQLFTQYGRFDLERNDVRRKADRAQLPERFDDPDLALSAQSDLATIHHLDQLIAKLESQILQQAQVHDRKALNLLQTIPGVGETLSLSILYEMHTLERFPTVQQFSSYCRLVRLERSSNGKNTGGGNRKIGNAYLKNAFMEIINVAQRSSAPIKKHYEKLQRKHSPLKARAIIAHKFAVAVYHMLKHGQGFDEQRFVGRTMSG
jgi:transposase